MITEEFKWDQVMAADCILTLYISRTGVFHLGCRGRPPLTRGWDHLRAHCRRQRPLRTYMS